MVWRDLHCAWHDRKKSLLRVCCTSAPSIDACLLTHTLLLVPPLSLLLPTLAYVRAPGTIVANVGDAKLSPAIITVGAVAALAQE